MRQIARRLPKRVQRVARTASCPVLLPVILPLLVIAASGAVRSAVAQDTALVAPASAQSRQPLELDLRVAGGMDAQIRDGSDAMPSLFTAAGIQWQREGSRLSGRLELSYFHREHEFGPLRFGGCPEACRDESESTILGLAFDGQLDLLRSTVRPYLLSGAGLYYGRFVRRSNYRCTGDVDQSVCTLGDGFELESPGLMVGLHTGIGVSAPIGGTRLFAETRLVVFPDREVTGASWLAPLVVGLRF